MKTGIDMITYLDTYIKEKFPDKYNYLNVHQIHSLKDILTDLLYILETGISYANIRSKISKSTLHRHMTFLSEHNVFADAYVSLLHEYFKKGKADKLKYQLIDTTFIANQYANNSNISRNKYYKNKKGYKISCITDRYGIPISVLLNKGSMHDSKFIGDHFKNMLICPLTNNYKNSNRYKQYMLADKAYDTLDFRKQCENEGYITIADYNKRNTKDITKIKKLTEQHKIIYKKRITVENSFSWEKKNKRIDKVYDRKESAYMSYYYLALIKIISKRININ